MADIASLNIRINSLEAKQAKQDLDRLTGAGKQAETQMGMMSKAAARLGGALVAAFSVHQLSQFVKTTALAYARFETLGVVMNTVGRNAGYSQREMASFEKSLRESGIAAIEARTVLTRMTQAQIDLTQSSKLARIAQDAAVIGNINSSAAFEQMIHGIQSAQVEVLRTIGLNVNFEQSYKALAEQLGITTDELTETQKAQARVNVVMEAGTRITGVYEASMNTAGKQLASMKRYTDDLKVSIGETFNEALVLLVKQTTLELKGMQNTMKGLKEDGSLSDWGSGFATVVAGTMDIILLVTATITSVTSTISAAIKQLRLVAEAVYDILSLDFAGAKANIKGFAEVGVEWWDKMEKKWTSPTFTDTLRKMRVEAEIASKAFQDTYDMDFGSWADGLEEAGDDLSDAAKRAAESLKDFQVQAALESYFADIDNYEDHMREKEEATIRAEESLKDIRIQQALDFYFDDIDNYEQHLKEKNDAEEKARKERERAEEKARQEYEREWERVYDDMHKFAADQFYDLFKDTEGFWENLLDTMEDMFYRSIANMASQAVMANIFGPLMQQMAGSTIGNMLGLPSAGGTNALSLLSMGNTAWNAFSGATSHMAYNALTALGVPGAVGGTAAQTAILAGGGSMAEAASVAGGSIGGSGLAGSIASFAPWAAMAAIAVPVVMNMLEDEPDFRMGVFAGTHNRATTPTSDKYWYHTNFQDLGDRENLGNDLIRYFDQRFALLDASTKSSINDLMKGAGDWGQSAWTDPTMYENNQQMLMAIESAVLRHLTDALVGDVVGADIAKEFGKDFFENIATEGEAAFDTFARFASVLNAVDDPAKELSRRIEGLGLSAEESFSQLQTVVGVLANMEAAYNQVMGQPFTAAIEQSIATWDAFIEVLKEAEATAEQVTEAEKKKNVVVGAQLSGLTKTSITQALLSGMDVEQIVQDAMIQGAAANLAQQLMSDYFEAFNQQASLVFKNLGWEGYIGYVNSYDFGPAKQAYKDFIEVIEEETKDLAEDLAEVVKEAQSAYNTAKNAYLDRLYAERDLLENELADARDNYLSLLQKEYTQLESNYNNAKSALEQVISNEERLIEARRNAAKSIENFITGLEVSNKAPVQSLGFFENRYNQLLEEARTAGPEDISDAVSNLTNFANQYLDFAAAYGGTGYKDRYASVISDLEDIGADQLLKADRQEAKLSDIKSAIDLSNTALKSLDDAFQDYLIAQDALEQGKWMKDELDTLQKTEGWTEDISLAQERYYAAKSALDNEWYSAEIAALEDIPTSIDELKVAMEQALKELQIERLKLFFDPEQSPFVKLWDNLSGVFGPIFDMVTGGGGSGGSGGGSSGSGGGGSSGGSSGSGGGSSGVTPMNPDTWYMPQLMQEAIDRINPSARYHVDDWYSKYTDKSGWGISADKINPGRYIDWASALLSAGLMNYDKVEEDFKAAVASGTGYRDGGIATGPMSGYPVTLHGTEAVIPLNNGAIPLQIQGGNQDIKVIVKIGDRELTDITTEIIRTDPEAQYEVRRVANG